MHRSLCSLSVHSVSSASLFYHYIPFIFYFFFSSVRPVLMGSLGVQLAVAMVSSISQHGVLYDGQGVLVDRESTLGNDSLSLTAHQRKCLTDSLLHKKVDDEDFLKRTVFETLVQLAGVRQALKVMLSPLIIIITRHIHNGL
jgi:hypothetical protein